MIDAAPPAFVSLDRVAASIVVELGERRPAELLSGPVAAQGPPRLAGASRSSSPT